MKELMKSKCMVGFLVILLGFLYINVGNAQKLNESRSGADSYMAVNR